jgi:hypothetical protein
MRRLLVCTLVAALAFAGCSSGGSKKKAAAKSTTSTTSSRSVTGEVLAPEANSTQGSGGTGITVNLVFKTRDASLLQASVRTAGGAAPGPNAAFPGLVVLLSTTPQSLGGPAANLADLFQLVGVSQLHDGSTEVRAMWVNAKPLWGIDVDSHLEVFVVNGHAPVSVPSDRNGLDVVSDDLQVDFHIAGGPAETTSTTATGSSTSTSSGRVTTTTRRATTTTVKPTTTTVKTTTTTGNTTTT